MLVLADYAKYLIHFLETVDSSLAFGGRADDLL